MYGGAEPWAYKALSGTLVGHLPRSAIPTGWKAPTSQGCSTIQAGRWKREINKKTSSPARPFAFVFEQLTEAVTPVELRAYAFTYVFHGLVVTVAALSNYALEHVDFAAPWLPWMVLMSLAAMVQTIRGRRQRSRTA